MTPGVHEVLVTVGLDGVAGERWDPIRRDVCRALRRAFPGMLVTVELSARPELAGCVRVRVFGGDSITRTVAETRAREIAESVLRREIEL